jgi:integrase
MTRLRFVALAAHPAADGLNGVRIHDLRHTFASIAVSGGDSLYLVGKVLGTTRPALLSVTRV